MQTVSVSRASIVHECTTQAELVAALGLPCTAAHGFADPWSDLDDLGIDAIVQSAACCGAVMVRNTAVAGIRVVRTPLNSGLGAKQSVMAGPLRAADDGRNGVLSRGCPNATT